MRKGRGRKALGFVNGEWVHSALGKQWHYDKTTGIHIKISEREFSDLYGPGLYARGSK